jgi:hypothetical protein
LDGVQPFIPSRRIRRLVQVDPKAARRAPVADAPETRERLRALAAARRRFGYRRLGLLFERENIATNEKKLWLVDLSLPSSDPRLTLGATDRSISVC